MATSTSAGCTPDHLAALVGFVLRCHHEVEKLTGIARREMLNTGEVRQSSLNWGRALFVDDVNTNIILAPPVCLTSRLMHLPYFSSSPPFVSRVPLYGTVAWSRSGRFSPLPTTVM